MKRREKKPAAKTETPAANSAAVPAAATGIAPGIGDDEAALFRNAVRDVAPLTPPDKISHPAKSHARPIPHHVSHHISRDEQSPGDSLSDYVSLEMEPGDEWSFLR
ncbi:MAG TPA: DNA mismatch repair protein MutS, partial [Nitrosospira sp.]